MTSLAGAAPGGKSITLDVDSHGFSDFHRVDNGGETGPFCVSGEILAPGDSLTIGTDVIDTFHCGGWIKSDAPRAVSGGIGDFVNARG